MSIICLANTCEKEHAGQTEQTEQEEVVLLSDLPDIPNCAELALEGITWKLIGFGNSNTQEIKLAYPRDCGGFYTFILKDNMVNGRTYSNSFDSFPSNEYDNFCLIDTLNNRIFFSNLAINLLPERYTGERFFKSLLQCSSFRFISKGLILYNLEIEEYLLFKPQDL